LRELFTAVGFQWGKGAAMFWLRKFVLYSWGAVVLVLLQTGWLFFARTQSSRRIERAASERMARRDSPALPATGGAGLRIPWFYANTGALVRGQQAVICYGVENATAVWLEPPVEQLAPTYNRCFAVVPERTTAYTLHALGEQGEVASASFSIAVTPPSPSILFVSVSAKQIRRGDPWTFCYGVRHATGVMLEPLGLKLPTVERRCTRFYPARSADFTLVATDELGRSERETVSLVVR
jgi:hypothetical protein